MSSKTGIALSIVAIVAVIALFESAPLVASAQAFPFGGFHGDFGFHHFFFHRHLFLHNVYGFYHPWWHHYWWHPWWHFHW
jgi:hypothetical protein